jgi:hypothetical protein
MKWILHSWIMWSGFHKYRLLGCLDYVLSRATYGLCSSDSRQDSIKIAVCLHPTGYGFT